MCEGTGEGTGGMGLINGLHFVLENNPKQILTLIAVSKRVSI